jgi:hypothetical protein
MLVLVLERGRNQKLRLRSTSKHLLELHPAERGVEGAGGEPLLPVAVPKGYPERLVLYTGKTGLAGGSRERLRRGFTPGSMPLFAD